jgi:glycosyltransferase involved in cell wall biosynthesis
MVPVKDISSDSLMANHASAPAPKRCDGLRVCHLSTGVFNHSYFEHLSRGVVANGGSVLLLSLTERRPPRWLQGDERIEYRWLDVAGRFRYPWVVGRLARMLGAEKVDILQTHLFDPTLIGVIAGRLAGVPVIVTRHHSDQHFLIGARAHVKIDSWMARLSSHVIAPSDGVRDHMIRKESVPSAKISTIHHGFDAEACSASEEDRLRIRRELGIEEDEFLIGCVAGNSRMKGHKYLLEAMGHVAPEIPGLRVLLLGTGDWSSVKHEVKARELDRVVVFGGFRQDVAVCMKAMDLLVHPSLSEAFCQVIIESMFVGTPVVATDVGIAHEALCDHQHARIVPPGDSGAIAAAVLELYRDPARRIQLAGAARELVTCKFAARRMTEQYLACYSSILADRKSAEECYDSAQV